MIIETVSLVLSIFHSRGMYSRKVRNRQAEEGGGRGIRVIERLAKNRMPVIVVDHSWQVRNSVMNVDAAHRPIRSCIS